MRLIWAGDARRDLLALAIASDYLTPAELIERIMTAPAILLAYPALGATTPYGNLRKWPIRRTPFLLLYEVCPDRIQIMRVVDARSDWQSFL
ncbi:MAG: type II toxin-antitoxin system RelE/ParE family toxin [Sphingopyxis sp.]